MKPLALSVTTPTDLEIVMTREFNAPRDMVWRFMTRPELIKQWLFLPPGWEMTVCHEDVRVGGAFHWAWNGPDGKEAMTMRGNYREVTPPERLSRTESFEMGGAPLGELLATISLKEQDGRTALTMRLLFPTKKARDGMLASGVDHGVSAGYDKLDELLAAEVV